MIKVVMAITAASGFLAVALGAFGAHLLKHKIPLEDVAIWSTANHYHFFHTLALFAIVLLMQQIDKYDLSLVLAAVFMVLGVLVFSGSLYLLAILKWKLLGMLTPLGGLCLLLAWLLLFISAVRTL